MNGSLEVDFSAVSQVRQAALFLHGVSDIDKDWLLRQLPLSHSSVLVDLLSELEELGVPKNSFKLNLESVAPVSEEVNILSPKKTTVDLSDMEKIDYLNKTSMTCLLKVFETEQLDVIVLFLTLYPWPWYQDFVANFHASKRFQLKERLENQASESLDLKELLAKKFNAALLHAVAQRVESLEKNKEIIEQYTPAMASKSKKIYQYFFGKLSLKR